MDHSTDNTPIRPRFLEWARHPLFHTRNGRTDEDIEVHEHRTAVIDVPLAQSRPVRPLFFFFILDV
jgi:hypothetical protein